MAISLDTNVVVDLVRHDATVRANYDKALRMEEPLTISVFVLQELLFGVEASGNVAKEKAKLGRLLRELEVVSFEQSDAEVGARAQAAMKRIGRKAPEGDFIVGAHALARGAALVTANTRDFENIPGLKLLNWRLPPEEQDTPHG